MTINEYLFTRWTDDCPIPASIIEQMRAAAGVPSHVDPFGIYMTELPFGTVCVLAFVDFDAGRAAVFSHLDERDLDDLNDAEKELLQQRISVIKKHLGRMISKETKGDMRIGPTERSGELTITFSESPEPELRNFVFISKDNAKITPPPDLIEFYTSGAELPPDTPWLGMATFDIGDFAFILVAFDTPGDPRYSIVGTSEPPLSEEDRSLVQKALEKAAIKLAHCIALQDHLEDEKRGLPPGRETAKANGIPSPQQDRALNRQERRAARRKLDRDNQLQPQKLTRIPPEQWPCVPAQNRVQVWRSREFLVQVFEEFQGGLSMLRLSVCRARITADGNWNDGITWDELQRIKRELGLGDRYAIEIYPRDVDIVNVANLRHLYVFEQPLPFGWFSKNVQEDVNDDTQQSPN